MNTAQLDKILADHALWLDGKGGKKANLMEADLTGADLTEADLMEADLVWARLTGANLTKTNLMEADLASARLTRANLTKTNLTGANLSAANLMEVDLASARLTGANLTRAKLTKANLTGANLTKADLMEADLTGANLTGAKLRKAPVIKNIDAAILAEIEKGGKLDMESWHTCATTHCRAGWTVILAGEAGKALEDKIGTNAAAALIYAASRPGQPVPDWFASNENAMADLRKGAG